MTAELPLKITPRASLRKQVEERSGQSVSACFQCQKCTNGCPVTFAMDIVPHKLIRLIHLGQADPVLRSKTLWVCASCETCTTRCPNSIDIAHLMDILRQISRDKGIKPPYPNIPVFHQEFLSSVKRHGRMNELEMAAMYTLKASGPAGLMKQANQGLTMLSKGKIKLLPSNTHHKKQVKEIFKKAEGKK